MEVMRFFVPIKGCRILASNLHPLRASFDYIGEVVKVDGGTVWFKDKSGDTDILIWRFRDGDNKFVWFCA